MARQLSDLSYLQALLTMLRSSFDEIVVVGKIAMFQLIPNHTIFGIQSHWHLSPNYACYAHADGNRGGDFSPLTVCFFRTISQKPMKLQDHQTWHRNVPRWVLENHLFWGQQIKVMSQPLWVFPLLWVLASSSFVIMSNRMKCDRIEWTFPANLPISDGNIMKCISCSRWYWVVRVADPLTGCVGRKWRSARVEFHLVDRSQVVRGRSRQPHSMPDMLSLVLCDSAERISTRFDRKITDWLGNSG